MNEKAWEEISQFKVGKRIDPEHMPLEEYNRKQDKEEKAGIYVGIIWDERTRCKVE